MRRWFKMKNEKRIYVLLPKTMHDQIWRKSRKLKVKLVAQSLMIEYLPDLYLQKRISNIKLFNLNI